MIMGVFFLGAVVVLFSLLSCSAIASSLQHFGEANQCKILQCEHSLLLCLLEHTYTSADTFGLANLFSGKLSSP